MTGTDQKWWGMHPSTARTQLTNLVWDALFYEDPHGTDGPVFRWLEQKACSDDDAFLGCAADQVVFTLLDHSDEVVRLLQQAVKDYPDDAA